MGHLLSDSELMEIHSHKNSRAIMGPKHTSSDNHQKNIALFKYLVYLFLIIISYKLAIAVAVSFGFFPRDELYGLGFLILTPLYLSVLVPAFLVIATISILLSMLFFAKSTLFQKIVDISKEFHGLSSFAFWVLLGLSFYVTLPFFDHYIESKKEEGFANRKVFAKKNAEYRQKEYEKYKEKVVHYNRQEALALVKKDGRNLQLLSDKFKKDKEIVYQAIKQNPYEGLKYADESLKSDRELVSMAVFHNGGALCMADEDLRKDRELLLTAIKVTKNPRFTLVCANKSFRKDKEVILALMQRDPVALTMADKSLKKDREVVLSSVKLAGYTLHAADDSFKKDRELVLKAVRQSGYALDYVDKSLKYDKEIVLTALKSNGGALRFATPEQQADKEFVLVAVKNDDQFCEALKYASMEMVDDKEIALAAVKHNGLALRHISMRLKHDKEVLTEAIKQNRHAIAFVPQDLQREFK